MRSIVFFDDRKILRLVNREERKKLSKFGAYVRQRAKTSIKPSKWTSRPGRPPASHTGRLRQLILFGYSEAQKTVAIGPILYRPLSLIPKLLEHGGRDRRGREYKARPFMRPAFDAELPGFLESWKDSIKE